MKLLALDTSTERMSLAITRHAGAAAPRVWQHQAAGGALASTHLVPAIRHLLQKADLSLAQLDAIAFGRGPGSFTGLRTACAVAQGLALGSGVPLLPVDTLLTLAEQARHDVGAERVVATLDARMDQIYAAHWRWHGQHWHETMAARLTSPEALGIDAGWWLAGNAQQVYGARLQVSGSSLDLLPDAVAMLRLAPSLLAQGLSVDAAHAHPLYIRDKVAQTTEERLAAKAALHIT